MYSLVIGVCHVVLRLRHTKSLKEKRAVTKSLIDRLRNLGFSTVECGQRENLSANLREAHLGFTFAGTSTEGVSKILESSRRLFVGDYEVLKVDKEIYRYEPEESDDLSWMIGQEDDVKE